MSGQGFRVHGPHDHELEHAQKGDHDGGHGDHGGMVSQIALFTAIIVTVGALFGYMAGVTQTNAGLFKNNAAIKKTEAANQWSYFQAKSIKQSLAEFACDLAQNDKKPDYQAKIDRYEKEKGDIKVIADKLEAQVTMWEQQSNDQLLQHHRWNQSTTVLQVAIALAVIALLTKKKWLEYAMFVAGGLGLLVGLLAALNI